MSFGGHQKQSSAVPETGNVTEEQISTSQEAVPVPYIAGERKVAARWISNIYNQKTVEIKVDSGKKGGNSKKGSSAGTGAYDYYGSLAAAVCCGPVDELVAIIVDTQQAWALGNVTREASADAPFRGTIAGKGDFVFYWGTETQTLESDSILKAENNNLGEDHPDFKGVAFIEFHDFLFGREKVSAPNIELVVNRKPVQSLVTGTPEELDDDQSNLLCSAAELLTSPRFGLNLPTALFDAASFQTAAAKLYDQRSLSYGSPLINQQTSMRSFLSDIGLMTDLFLKWDDTGGQIEAGIWPHGESIDPDTLQLITADDLTAPPELDQESWTGMETGWAVTFTDRERVYKDSSEKYDDLSLLEVTGEPNRATLSRPYITRREQAIAHAAEWGKSRALPMLEGKISVRKSRAQNLSVGSLFRLDIDAEPGGGQLNQVFRITEKRERKAGSVDLTIEAETNLLPLGFTPIIPNGPGDGGELQEPDALGYVRPVELPPKLSETDYGIAVLAQRADSMTIGFQLLYDDDAAGDFPDIGNQRSFGVRCALDSAFADTAKSADEVGYDAATDAPVLDVAISNTIDLLNMPDDLGLTVARDNQLLLFLMEKNTGGIEIIFPDVPERIVTTGADEAAWNGDFLYIDSAGNIGTPRYSLTGNDFATKMITKISNWWLVDQYGNTDFQASNSYDDLLPPKADLSVLSGTGAPPTLHYAAGNLGSFEYNESGGDGYTILVSGLIEEPTANGEYNKISETEFEHTENNQDRADRIFFDGSAWNFYAGGADEILLKTDNPAADFWTSDWYLTPYGIENNEVLPTFVYNLISVPVWENGSYRCFKDTIWHIQDSGVDISTAPDNGKNTPPETGWTHGARVVQLDGQIKLDSSGFPIMEVLSVSVMTVPGSGKRRIEALRGRFGTARRAFGVGAEAWLVYKDTLRVFAHNDFPSIAATYGHAYFKTQPYNVFLSRDISGDNTVDFIFPPARLFTPKITLTSAPTNGVIGVALSVEGSITDQDGDLTFWSLSYRNVGAGVQGEINVAGGPIKATSKNDFKVPVRFVEAGTYEIIVRAKDNTTFTDSFVEASFQTAITVSGDQDPPGAPTNLSTTTGFLLIWLEWTNPPAADFDYIEIWESADNDLANAVKIDETGAAFYARSVTTEAEKYYWVRAVDTSGNVGPYNAGQTSGTLGTAAALINVDDIESAAITAEKIAAGAIEELAINDGAITVNKVATGAITTAKISDSAIEADKIAANAVIADKIAANAVIASKIAANAITADKIAAGAITAAKLSAGEVITNAAQIANAIITDAKIANLSVNKLHGGTIGAIQMILAANGVFKSANYSAGSAGLMINGNGAAEFNNVTIRGGSQVGGISQSANYVEGVSGAKINWSTGEAEFYNVNIYGSVPMPQVFVGATELSNGNTYTYLQNVTLTISTQSGTTAYYRTDGMVPSGQTSELVPTNGQITLSGKNTLRVVAFENLTSRVSTTFSADVRAFIPVPVRGRAGGPQDQIFVRSYYEADSIMWGYGGTSIPPTTYANGGDLLQFFDLAANPDGFVTPAIANPTENTIFVWFYLMKNGGRVGNFYNRQLQGAGSPIGWNDVLRVLTPNGEGSYTIIESIDVSNIDDVDDY